MRAAALEADEAWRGEDGTGSSSGCCLSIVPLGGREEGDALPKPSDAHCGLGAGQSAHFELPGSLIRDASSFFL